MLYILRLYLYWYLRLIKNNGGDKKKKIPNPANGIITYLVKQSRILQSQQNYEQLSFIFRLLKEQPLFIYGEAGETRGGKHDEVLASILMLI